MENLILLVAIVAVVAMASLGEKRPGWRIAAYVSMALVGLGALLLGVVYLVLAAAQQAAPASLAPDLAANLANMRPLRLGLGLLVGGVASWLALAPPVRRALARIIPVRPDSTVNAVALALLALLWAQSIGLSGMGPEGFLALSGSLGLGQVLLSELPLAALALAGAGLLTRRSAAETWQRLGLGGLSWRDVGLSLAGVAGLLAFEVALNAVGSRVAPQAFNELDRATLELYRGIDTPLAAALVALASGTAEELLFRGALQPRLGLVLTALTFGVLHLQYGVTWALLSIGVIGLVLGLYRQRLNTTACILVHATYNLILFLLPR
ncbi:MAG TPA: type II CAAX endopeptidase family protein [Anaerolineae bacterium]|nr:type II CAAX endopeptidase family protein [Anaerolineae bacterium]HOQ99252.1 type II CAAX endopeptidase family protein [Anaerolineae bacterium]HPL29730.1 type II CAAX endopeptidase family protein [Anaerolineae bacterium]